MYLSFILSEFVYSQIVHLRHEKRRRKLPELPKNRSIYIYFFSDTNVFLK